MLLLPSEQSPYCFHGSFLGQAPKTRRLQRGQRRWPSAYPASHHRGSLHLSPAGKLHECHVVSTDRRESRLVVSAAIQGCENTPQLLAHFFVLWDRVYVMCVTTWSSGTPSCKRCTCAQQTQHADAAGNRTQESSITLSTPVVDITRKPGGDNIACLPARPLTIIKYDVIKSAVYGMIYLFIYLFI